ncbi:hypothetical protein [Roseospira visakhapatnamensis]|uniref:Uncharacterized protein n=1 Tax=Roseospira visakhapatnamensis TaxID=390880 RepID=A0A7W6RF27_9PROT|nr:hypothetical protein [Roseospira visakhapatnamensis]MBB4267369.1 hypothetical protein [Roseospira visakhapatnamensis]
MDWIVTHWDDLLLIVTGLISVASAIAALTPTPADDRLVGALRRIVEALALNVGHARPAPPPPSASAPPE